MKEIFETFTIVLTLGALTWTVGKYLWVEWISEITPAQWDIIVGAALACCFLLLVGAVGVGSYDLWQTRESRIAHLEWEWDRSQARNEALSRALSETSHRLRRLTEKTEAVNLCVVTSLEAEGEGTFEDCMNRTGSMTVNIIRFVNSGTSYRNPPMASDTVWVPNLYYTDSTRVGFWRDTMPATWGYRKWVP